MNVPAPNHLLLEATTPSGAGTDPNASRQDTPRDLFAQLLAQGPQLAARSPGAVTGSAGEAVFEIGAPTPGAQETRLDPRPARTDDARDDPYAADESSAARGADGSEPEPRETAEPAAAPLLAPIALESLLTPARSTAAVSTQATASPQTSDAPTTAQPASVQTAHAQPARPMPVDGELPADRPRGEGAAAGLKDVQVTVSDRSTQLTSRPSATLAPNTAMTAAQPQAQAPAATTTAIATPQAEVAVPAIAAEPTADDGATPGQQTRLTLAGVAGQNTHPGQAAGPAQPPLPGPAIGPAAAVVAPAGAQTGGQGFDANLSRFGQGGQQSASGGTGQGSAPAAAGASASSFASLTGPQASQAPARRAAANPQFARQVQNQVAVHITRAAAQGLDKIAIQLKPQDLGRIDVKMELGGDGQVRASVLVEKPETLELLQRDARGLERALADAGLKTGGDGLQFSLRGDGGAGHGARGDGSDGADSRTASADAPFGTGPEGPAEVALGVNLRAAEGGMDMTV